MPPKIRSPVEILNVRIILTKKKYTDEAKRLKLLHRVNTIGELPLKRREKLQKIADEYKRLLLQRNRMARGNRKPKPFKPILDEVKEEQLDTMEGGGVVDFLRQVFTGRDQLDPASQKVLDDNADSPIKKLFIVRKVVTPSIQEFLNIITAGKFKKEMLKAGHDTLFHLSAAIQLKNRKMILIEKNETVKLKYARKFKKGDDFRPIKLDGVLKFGDSINKTINSYPSKKDAFGYDSITNNCQKFISKFLTVNPEIKQTPEDLKWINQDTQFIIENFPALPSVMKIITDIAGRLNVIMKGGENKISGNNIKHNMPAKKMKGKGGCEPATKEEMNAVGVKKWDDVWHLICCDPTEAEWELYDKIRCHFLGSESVGGGQCGGRKLPTKAQMKKVVKGVKKVVGDKDIKKIGKTVFKKLKEGVKMSDVKKLVGMGPCISDDCLDDDFEGIEQAVQKREIERIQEEAKRRKIKEVEDRKERFAKERSNPSPKAQRRPVLEIVDEQTALTGPNVPLTTFRIPPKAKKFLGFQKGGEVALPQAIGRAGNPIFSGMPMPQVRSVSLGPIESVGEGIQKMRKMKCKCK